MLWPAASATAFFSAHAALAPLSSTFVAPAVALPPFKHHNEQRLEDFDRVDTTCSVPRSKAEEAVATDAISTAAASSDASIRAAFGQALLSAFRERGFLRLRLSADELALVRELDRMQRAFFSQTREMKDPSFDPSNEAAKGKQTSNYQKAHGYSSSHACRKEFFVVRQRPQSSPENAAASGAAATSASAAASSANAAASPATAFAASSSSSSSSRRDPWSLPSSPSSFPSTVWPVFHRLGLVCQQLTSLLLEALGAHSVQVKELIKGSMEPGRNDEENRFTSVIELFHYSVTGSAAGAAAAGAAEAAAPLPCSMHSDASLLTLIPRCTGSPGLQLYNWSASAWQAVEAQCSEEEAIVFPGDMMQRISNGGVIASPHRVAFDPSGPSAQEQHMTEGIEKAKKALEAAEAAAANGSSSSATNSSAAASSTAPSASAGPALITAFVPSL